MLINMPLCCGSRWSYYHCRSSCRPHHNFKPLYILSWLYTYVNTCRPKNQTWYYSACGFAKGRTRTREVADGEGEEVKEGITNIVYKQRTGTGSFTESYNKGGILI